MDRGVGLSSVSEQLKTNSRGLASQCIIHLVDFCFGWNYVFIADIAKPHSFIAAQIWRMSSICRYCQHNSKYGYLRGYWLHGVIEQINLAIFDIMPALHCGLSSAAQKNKNVLLLWW